ncbi:helix-turn-helix domain-containing protein [Moraxella nonliquefaciens]|jgi:hypothetical protein|uniref:Uncharacterized protein n=1 Tax=Moraxella nonliquefaciens TaxID=478 RepID=A0A1B8PIZ5_MORNO|nr:helix-turn-helix domain-containing protein [Moraxella nonliquefaciens]OBX49643.1 hypothetical protein A9Z60_03160 [Moraxella nonliquefaciens]
MAKKDKVPVVAIRQIVKMRDDEYHNYSYRAIAEHLKDEFGIEVTPQAIGYLYRKNKDNFSNQVVAEKTEEKKPFFKPKPPMVTISEPLFEKDEETDLKDYFS